MSEATESVETCPIHAIRPMLPENLAYPVAMNRRLRKDAPVYQDPDSGLKSVSLLFSNQHFLFSTFFSERESAGS